MSIKNALLLISILIVGIITVSSCSKSVDFCVTLDASEYAVNDTIYGDASCSKNGDEFLWEPEKGLLMIGNGTASTERFIVQALTGTLSRTINITVSNSKSSRSQSKSVLVL